MISVRRLPLVDPLKTIPSLAQELAHEWFVWDAWVGGRRRVDLHPLVLSPDMHAAAAQAAERAWALVTKAADRVTVDENERALYRFHPDVERLASAARKGRDLGSVARVDLLLHEDGRFVACEVNADCPGGHNETMALPRLARAAGHRAGSDPTHVATRLADRLVELSGGPGSPRGLIALVYATGYAEDLQVCALIERLVLRRGGRTVRIVPTALKADPIGPSNVMFKGERVAVLYRFYPTEYMAGQRNIDAIVAATAAGELSSLTSFAYIHAQSKLAMARAWALNPRGASEVFPETYAFGDVPPERLVEQRADWVLKRDLSRVGDHVFVGSLFSDDEFREIVGEVRWVIDEPPPSGAVRAGEACEQVWIAQRYIPQRAIETPWGPRLVTLGVYVIDGSFAGYFARLSPTSHCSHDALVLPVFTEAA